MKLFGFEIGVSDFSEILTSYYGWIKVGDGYKYAPNRPLKLWAWLDAVLLALKQKSA